MCAASFIGDPKLPVAVGPLSAAVLELIVGRPPRRTLVRTRVRIGDADPYGLDLHLALAVCYELHHRGFCGIDDRWEWDPGLLHLRAGLEASFEDALLREVGAPAESETAVAEMDSLSVEPVEDLSHFLRDEGTWEQMREYFVHRSLHHPRALDEYGVGHHDGRNALLFAALLRAARLDTNHLAYLNHVPAEALAVMNLVELFALHRSWRGAAVGHFAATEITRPPVRDRMVEALQRMGAPEACVRFHAEDAGVDTVRGRPRVVDDLLRREPHLDRDVVFGSRARDLVEERLSAHMMKSWVSGRSSLRRLLL